MSAPIRVGVIGCGVIAQVMHLPHLSQVRRCSSWRRSATSPSRSPTGCAARFGARAAFTDWRDMLESELDAVMVLTSGNHAPIAIAAAQAGAHVFVEKPMALSVGRRPRDDRRGREGRRLPDGRDDEALRPGLRAARPSCSRRSATTCGLRRVTTLESPFEPYVTHYPLLPPSPGPARADRRTAQGRRGDRRFGARRRRRGHALRLPMAPARQPGPRVQRAARRARGADRGRVREPRARGCVGEPHFGEIPVHLSWVDLLSGIARYKQEFAFYSPEQRMTLELPSPYLRNEPSRLIVEGGEIGTTHSWVREEIRLLRRGVQAGARRVRRLHRDRAPAAHLRVRRPCRRAPVRGGGAQASRAGCGAGLRRRPDSLRA